MNNFSYVIPGHLAGMAYPHDYRDIPQLVAMGFRSMVSLSYHVPDLDLLTQLVHLHVSLPDFARIPSIDLHRVMVFLKKAPSPIVVHCQGGIGRTGVALACFFVISGEQPEEAIAHVRRERPGSIDHPDLEASVREYCQFYQKGVSLESAPFNFGPASPLDRIVYGSKCPPESEPLIHQWMEFMKRQGIKRVLCLLPENELAIYPKPLLELYRHSFVKVTHVPIQDRSFSSLADIKMILEELEDSWKVNEPIVVHCAAGIGRTGAALAAWIKYRYDWSAEDAINKVHEYAQHFGVKRKPLDAGKDMWKLISEVNRPSPG